MRTKRKSCGCGAPARHRTCAGGISFQRDTRDVFHAIDASSAFREASTSPRGKDPNGQRSVKVRRLRVVGGWTLEWREAVGKVVPRPAHPLRLDCFAEQERNLSDDSVNVRANHHSNATGAVLRRRGQHSTGCSGTWIFGSYRYDLLWL